MTPAVELKGVSKTYGEGALAVQALRGVDLTVNQGEFLMLVGPSGSGKTTLLSILGCVLSQTSGEGYLFGQPLHGRKEQELPSMRLSYVGFIFQGHNLMSALTAEQNVALPLELRGYSHQAALEEARQTLIAVGLGDTRTLRVRMDVDERDIARVKHGVKAWVTADAFGPRRFEGKVVEIGRRFGRKNIRTDDPVEKNDTKILEVVLELEAHDLLVPGQRVMSFVTAGPGA